MRITPNYLANVPFQISVANFDETHFLPQENWNIQKRNASLFPRKMAHIRQRRLRLSERASEQRQQQRSSSYLVCDSAASPSVPPSPRAPSFSSFLTFFRMKRERLVLLCCRRSVCGIPFGREGILTNNEEERGTSRPTHPTVNAAVSCGKTDSAVMMPMMVL